MLPDLMLIRVGPTDPANNQLKKHIRLQQYQNIAEDQMPLFYNASDVFTFPSIYEGGIAYPPMEAMACGIPTIITNALELFKNGCVMLPAQNPDALAATMYQILTDADRHKELSLSALNEAKKYTLSREIEETKKVYEDILK